MTLAHSTVISPSSPYGGDLAARGRLRLLERIAAARTLSDAARAAILDPSSITISQELLVELEGNRTGYAQTVAPVWVDGGAAVAVVDSSVSDPAVIFDGRNNPTVKLAVADVSLADDVSVASGSGGSDVKPYGLNANATATVREAGAPATHGWTLTVGGTLATVADAASPHPSGRAFEVTTPTAGSVIGPAFSPSAYRLPAPGDADPRLFSLLAHLRAVGGDLVARLRVTFRATDGTTVVYAGPSFTLAAAADYARRRGEVSTAIVAAGAHDAAKLYREARWELEILAGTTATSIRFAAPEVYAGPDRGSLQGLNAAAPPSGGVALDVSFTGGARSVSRVDVHGETRLGHVSAASVYIGGVFKGSAAGPGRLSIRFPATLTSSYRVVVEEVTSGDGGDVWLSEVDAQLVLDLGERVVGSTLTASRETDAGSTTLPLGTFEAATLSVEVDNTPRDLSPSANAAIGTGHRLESAYRIHLPGGAVEALPGGVFYVTGWDAPSDSMTARLEAVDRMGVLGSVAVDEPVTTNASVATLVADLALKYLDLDSDELLVELSSGHVLPYAYPTGDVGTYLADLAKAVSAVVSVDRLERLRFLERITVPAAPDLSLTEANAVVRAGTPISVERIRAIVEVEASPLGSVLREDVYTLGDTEGISVAAGATLDLFAPFTKPLVLDAAVGTVTFSAGTAAVSILAAYAGLATVRIVNSGGVAATLSALTLTGIPLEESPLKVRKSNAAAVKRYGARVATVSARLVQTLARLDGIATEILALFSGVDETTGERVLPDVEVDTLGLPFTELGDRVSVRESGSGIGEDYQVLAHTLTYGRGLASSLTGRRAGDEVFARADVSLADDGQLAAF